jgi:hypothetical protein
MVVQVARAMGKKSAAKLLTRDETRVDELDDLLCRLFAAANDVSAGERQYRDA